MDGDCARPPNHIKGLCHVSVVVICVGSNKASPGQRHHGICVGGHIKHGGGAGIGGGWTGNGHFLCGMGQNENAEGETGRWPNNTKATDTLLDSSSMFTTRSQNGSCISE